MNRLGHGVVPTGLCRCRGLALVLAALAWASNPRPACAENPPMAAIGMDRNRTSHPISRPSAPAVDAAAPCLSGNGLILGVGAGLAGLGVGAAVARARWGGGSGLSGGLQVVGRVALGPGQAAMLLRAGDRLLVVGTARGAAPRLLAELDATGPPAPLIPGREGGRS